MYEHIGNRVKFLVENNFQGTKVEFADRLGLKHKTYLFEIFNKKDLGTELIRKVASILNVPASIIIEESINAVEEPQAVYNQKFKEQMHVKHLNARIGDLELIIKMQKKQIEQYESQISQTVKKSPQKKQKLP